MTIAVNIKRGDEVTFTPSPRYRSNLRKVQGLTVFDLVRDGATTLLTFSIEGNRHQIMLPNNHPVEIHRHAG